MPVPTFTSTPDAVQPTIAPQSIVEATPVPIILVPTNTPAPAEPTIAPATEVPPLPTDTPFVAPAAVATCDCSGDSLNCGDFGTRDDAHNCFDYCMATVGFDVHNLDGDNDGQFCESR